MPPGVSYDPEVGHRNGNEHGHGQLFPGSLEAVLLDARVCECFGARCLAPTLVGGPSLPSYGLLCARWHTKKGGPSSHVCLLVCLCLYV